MTKKPGLFIVLEGCEGVGKSTNMAFVAEYLKAKNIPFESTREPGGTPIAEAIRELLLNHHAEKMADLTELLLMFAARAQHLSAKIKPALAAGNWLLCDRFTDATYAYQGGGRQLDKQLILQLEQLVQNTLRPDAVILLTAPLAVGLNRAKARANLDRLESEDLAFHERVQKAYLERATAANYHIVDASQSLQQVQKEIAKVLDGLIEQYYA